MKTKKFLLSFIFLIFLFSSLVNAERFGWTVEGTATETWSSTDYKYSGYICYNCFGTDSWECPKHAGYEVVEMKNPYGGDSDGLCGCPTQLLDSPRLLDSHDHTSPYYCTYEREIPYSGTLTRTDFGIDRVEISDREKLIKDLDMDFTTDPNWHGGRVSDIQYSIGDDNDKVRTWISGNSLMACIDLNRNDVCDSNELEGDSDLDGVADSRDECLGTPLGCNVDANGCERDSDNDGSCNGLDCDNSNPNRFPGNMDMCEDGIDQDCSGRDERCPAQDRDWDGIPDYKDSCDDTEFGCLIDGRGCTVDSDKDGICDPALPFYVQVSATGTYKPVDFGWTVSGRATETYQVSQKKYSSSICYNCFGSDEWICPEHSVEGWIVKEMIRLPYPGSDSDYRCGCPTGLYDSYPGPVASHDDTTAFYCVYEKLEDKTQSLTYSDSGSARVNPDKTLAGNLRYSIDFSRASGYKGGRISSPSASISVDNPAVAASITQSLSGNVLFGDIRADSSATGPWSDKEIASGIVEPDDKNKLIFTTNLASPSGDTVYNLDYIAINGGVITDNSVNDEGPGDNSIGFDKVFVWLTGREVRGSSNFKPPLAVIDLIEPFIAKEGEEIDFSGHGEDEDGFITAFRWVSHLDGFLSSMAVFERILSIGTHVIRFTVRDNDNQWSPEANDLIKVNAAPVAYMDSVPDVVVIGEPAVFAGRGIDSDGFIVEYEWSSDIDDRIGTNAIVEISDLTIGIHNISLRVRDNNGEWSEAAKKEVTVRRTPVIYIHGGQALTAELNYDIHPEILDPLKDNRFDANADVYFDYRDMKQSAGLLDEIVEIVKQQTGSKRVDIVAHSMGGLISRWFVNFGPRNDVRKLILIGVPNHGSDWAYLGDIKILTGDGFKPLWAVAGGGPAVPQMKPHNPFLITLNNNDKCATYGEGIDQINRLARHHVISGEKYPTPAHKHLHFELCFKLFGRRVCLIKFHEIIPWVTMKGDGVVAVRSAYLSDTPSDERRVFHFAQEPGNENIYPVVRNVLTEDDPIRRGKSVLDEPALDYDYYENVSYYGLNEFKGELALGERTVHEFEVDSSVEQILITSEGMKDIEIVDQNGNDVVASGRAEVYESETGVTYVVGNPAEGKWQISVSARRADEAEYSIKVLLKTDLFASFGTDKEFYEPGEPIVIIGFMKNADEFLTGANLRAEIKKPNGKFEIIELFDNGLGFDDVAGDGIYTNALEETSLEGMYEMTVRGRIEYEGEIVERSVRYDVPVEFLPDLVVSSESIRFSNPNPEHGDEVIITADVVNTGDEDAENVEVLFFDRDPRKDGRFIGKTMIDRVMSESTMGKGTGVNRESVSVTWKAEYGNHDINAVISPYARYLDGNYSNNKAERKIITSDNMAPIADAGPDMKVVKNGFVRFDASRSEDNVLITEYKWDVNVNVDSDGDGIRDNDADLTGQTAVLESGYSEPGIYIAQLNVNDEAGNRGTDRITVSVVDEPDTEAPVANAGENINAVEGQPFKFDATSSSDNYAVTIYQWDVDTELDSSGDSVSDNDVDLLGPMPTFVYNVPGVYDVKLTLDDAAGNGPVEDYVKVRVDILDSDGDGIRDKEDNCPYVANREQRDSDLDGQGDECDACPLDEKNDVDGDGICGNEDNCPGLGNGEQDDCDEDGLGDACDTDSLCSSDSDFDGVVDIEDNCVDEFNPIQEDSDEDGLGDICDIISEVPDVSWQVTISATNQLEPVIVGMIPDAQDGKDEYDEFTQPPVMGKVILSLDTVYATSIKKTRAYGVSVDWDLSVGVPAGQSTVLEWEIPSNVNLTILNGEEVLEPGARLGEGDYELRVIAELLEYTTFNLELKRGWNMVSIPLIVEDDSVDSVFNCVSTLGVRPAMTWKAPSFVPVDRVEPKKGYWVFTPFDRVCEIIGKPIEDKTFSLEMGWNMVGSAGLIALDISQIPNQVAARPAMTWRAPSFVETAGIEPGEAAWVFVTSKSVFNPDEVKEGKSTFNMFDYRNPAGVALENEGKDSWNLVISATNDLEGVRLGINPSATDEYNRYSQFTKLPEMNKVILSLDDIYATRINRDRYIWKLNVGVLQGQNTKLSWDLSDVPSNIRLTIDDVDMREQEGLRLGEGSYNFVINAEIKEAVQAEFIRGDVNSDSKVDIADAVFILSYLFRAGPKPACMDAADVNDDGKLDISDAVYLLNYIFAGGKKLPEPFPEPGVDPTQDKLNCGG